LSTLGNLGLALVGVAGAAAIAACSPKGADSAAAPGVAPAAAAPTAADSGSSNQLIGSWTLMPTDDAACADSVQFTDTTYTTVSKGVSTSNPALYHAYSGYVNVFVNGDLAHYQQYNLTSADVITNVTGNQYAINNCPYKRA
jgi:hypothetical protein